VSDTVALNELAAFNLTFNRPAAGTADLSFTRVGGTNFVGTFTLLNSDGIAILPNAALTSSYASNLTITILQQAGFLAAVPEPGSVLAVSVVLGGLGIRVLRRRRQTKTT